MENDIQTPPALPPAEPKKFKLPKTVSIKLLAIVAVILALGFLAYYYKHIVVAALVDGKPIYRLSIVKELEKQSGAQVIESLINQQIINNEAASRNIVVSQDEIDSQIKKIEDQFASQQRSLDEALEGEGLTRADLRKQVVLQLKAEKIIADKINVSDEDVNNYISDNQVALESGQEDLQRNQIREQLKQQKFSQEITTWLNEARAESDIKTFVNY